MKNTKIIAAFPACGKTYCVEHLGDRYTMLDSDSSEFSWMFRKRTEEELEIERKAWDSEKHAIPGYMYINKIRNADVKVRNPEFPNNYISHIKENIGKVDYIFVSTHEEVRKALADAGINFILVFPEHSCRAEWVGRCFLRGSGERFCSLIADNWDYWLSQMWAEVELDNRSYYCLKHNEFLENALVNLDS